MGDAADNLSNQRGGLDEALSEKFNVTNGLQRKYLEGDKETTENFKNSKGVVAPNFLEPWLADKLYSFIAIESPSDWWAYATNETVDGTIKRGSSIANKEVFQIFAENKVQRDSMYNGALNCLKNKKFGSAYSKQLGNSPGKWKFHNENCDCIICDSNLNGIFRKGGEFEAAVSNIVSEDVEIVNLQWVRFSAGDFIAPHSTHNSGNIAFSLSMNKNWFPMWGGNRIFLDEDMNITDTAPSTFNTLSLWDVRECKTWSAVTPVIPTIQQSRYAILGWLS